MQKNFDQYDNTVGLEFDLDIIVTELAARGTCRWKFATRGTQVFKSVFQKNQLSYPAIQILSLKFHAQLEMNVIYFIIKSVTIVHFEPNNNYYHACYRKRIFVIKNFQVICQIN